MYIEIRQFESKDDRMREKYKVVGFINIEYGREGYHDIETMLKPSMFGNWRFELVLHKGEH